MPRYTSIEGEEYTASSNTKLIWYAFAAADTTYNIAHGLKRKPRRVRVIAIEGVDTREWDRAAPPATIDRVYPAVYNPLLAFSEKQVTLPAANPVYSDTVDATFDSSKFADGDVATVGITAFIPGESLLVRLPGITTAATSVKLHYTAAVAGTVKLHFVKPITGWVIAAAPVGAITLYEPAVQIHSEVINVKVVAGWQTFSWKYAGTWASGMVIYLEGGAGTSLTINEIEVWEYNAINNKSDFPLAMGHTETNLKLAASAPCLALLEVV